VVVVPAIGTAIEISVERLREKMENFFLYLVNFQSRGLSGASIGPDAQKLCHLFFDGTAAETGLG
jgi:hypothetical protein